MRWDSASEARRSAGVAGDARVRLERQRGGEALAIHGQHQFIDAGQREWAERSGRRIAAPDGADAVLERDRRRTGDSAGPRRSGAGPGVAARTAAGRSQPASK